LSNIITERPDGKAGAVPCDTWDNATLLIDMLNPADGQSFPWTLRTARIAPGETNTWYLRILGTQASVRFSTANPKLLEVLEYDGRQQTWQQVQTGSDTAYKTITGPIFEFGFTDAILQMWAAFCHELVQRRVPSSFAGCVTMQETATSHRIFTAALQSQRTGGIASADDA
jgi:predicted dehydrogenase